MPEQAEDMHACGRSGSFVITTRLPVSTPKLPRSCVARLTTFWWHTQYTLFCFCLVISRPPTCRRWPTKPWPFYHISRRLRTYLPYPLLTASLYGQKPLDNSRARSAGSCQICLHKIDCENARVSRTFTTKAMSWDYSS